MRIGTFARNNEQLKHAIAMKPDFVDLRLDFDHSINFGETKKFLSDAGIGCTLHLPSNPDWRPMDLPKEIVPYIDLGRVVDAELVSIHTTLSTLFYSDEEIDLFLGQVPILCDAARESGMQVAVETLGLYYTELQLLCDSHPEIAIVLDIGHGQIMAKRNRSLSHIDSFINHIKMVNVHDNNGHEMVDEVLKIREKRGISVEETRELARKYDEHLPIGEGSIDFQEIFTPLKQTGYDERFLMMCSDPSKFEEERRKFLELWVKA